MAVPSWKLAILAIMPLLTILLVLTFLPGLPNDPIGNSRYLVGYLNGWQGGERDVYFLDPNPRNSESKDWFNHDNHQGCTLFYAPVRSPAEAREGISAERDFFEQAEQRDPEARPVGVLCTYSGPAFVLGAVESRRSLAYKQGFNRAVACSVAKRAGEVESCPPV